MDNNNNSNSNKLLKNESKIDFNASLFKSKLGNKDYWDELYRKEKNQFCNNIQLGGEIWFGQQVQDKVINYINKLYSNNFDVKIIDIGCGNSEFLFALQKQNYNNLTGIDYSKESIEFVIEKCKKLFAKDNLFELYEIDLNSKNINNYLKEKKFNLIHDKGTFDAFMLLESNNYINYVNYIKELADKDNLMIITSCNFNKEELLYYFKNSIELIDEISYKKFSFGGSSGQTVTTLVFKIIK